MEAIRGVRDSAGVANADIDAIPCATSTTNKGAAPGHKIGTQDTPSADLKVPKVVLSKRIRRRTSAAQECSYK